MYGNEGWSWPLFHGFGFVLMMLVLAAIVWAVAVALRATGHRPRDAGAPDRSLTILRERYARGELTPEQFAQMKRELD